MIFDLDRQKVAADVDFSFQPVGFMKNINYAAMEYLLNGSTSNKSIVEQSFEVMSRMPLKPNIDYTFENNNEFLCLHLIGIYDKFTRYKRDCTIVGEVLSCSQFKKQLELSEFFIEKIAENASETIPKRYGQWTL